MAALFVVLFTLTSNLATAKAYDGNAAANYADQYALRYNTSYRTGSGDGDCTNFVSQSFRAGGYSMVNPSNIGFGGGDDHNWYYVYNSTLNHLFYSSSWYKAPDLYTFLWVNIPGGHGQNAVAGTNKYYSSGLNRGDVLFYDFGGLQNSTQVHHPIDYTGLYIEHAAIQTVNYGTDYNVWANDPSNPYSDNGGWVGSLVDQHTTDRYHAFWTLYPYNPHQATTWIYPVAVDPNNH